MRRGAPSWPEEGIRVAPDDGAYLDEETLRLIEQRVRQLIRQGAVNAGDAEDLAQELTF